MTINVVIKKKIRDEMHLQSWKCFMILSFQVIININLTEENVIHLTRIF